MKKLYSFQLFKEIEIDESEITKNNKDEAITITKKVKKQEPHNFFIAKPTRSLSESAEMFYASIVAQCVKNGILPANLLQKRFLNDGGVLSEEQKKNYDILYSQLFEKQALHKQLISKLEQTEQDKEETNKVFNEIVDILTQIQSFENQTGNVLYQNTAENIARNRTSLWWTLHLSYEEKDQKETPVFGNGTYEIKAANYDKLEEEGSEFNLQLLNKLFLVVSLWYLGKAEKQEDFDILLKVHENQDLINLTSNSSKEENNKQLELKIKN